MCDPSEVIHFPVSLEMSSYCDLVEFTVLDAYMNNTLKVTSLLKYVVEGSAKFGWSPDYLFLMDDDSWVNIGGLWDRLFEEDDHNVRHSFF